MFDSFAIPHCRLFLYRLRLKSKGTKGVKVLLCRLDNRLALICKQHSTTGRIRRWEMIF